MLLVQVRARVTRVNSRRVVRARGLRQSELLDHARCSTHVDSMESSNDPSFDATKSLTGSHAAHQNFSFSTMQWTNGMYLNFDSTIDCGRLQRADMTHVTHSPKYTDPRSSESF